MSAHHPRSLFRSLPTQRAADPTSRDIVVIGAGAAGLSAAYELAFAGHRVTVLEARDRPGGRVETLRGPFVDGMHAEAGAMFLPSHHTLTVGYARHFALPLTPIDPAAEKSIAYIRRTLIPDPRSPAAPWPFTLPAAERVGLLGLWGRYVLPTVLKEIGDPRDPAWPSPAVLAYDRMAFSEFLKSRGASPEAIEILRMGYIDAFGEGADAVSALWVLRDLSLTVEGIPPQVHPGFSIATDLPDLAAHAAPVQEAAQCSYQIEGGNDLLPRAFAGAEALAGRIAYGAPVVRIEESNGRLAVVYAETGRRRRLEADHVVCAVPFAVLRNVDIAAPLSDAKRSAIARLRNTSVVRVYVQTRTRLWERLGRSPFANTDLPGTCVNHQTVTQQGGSGILEAYAAGKAARALAVLDDDARARVTIAWLNALYPGLASEVVATASKSWDDDEWARGGYCCFDPGEIATLAGEAARPEGRLHFAGDHASVLPGWLEGAFESALRVVDEIRQGA